MRARRREINIFNMSLLDILCGALGAFCFMTLVLLPYYKAPGTERDLKEQQQKVDELMKELETLKQNVSDPETAQRLHELVQQLEAEMKQMQGQLNSARSELAQAREQAAAAQQQNQQLTTENQQLNNRLSSRTPFLVLAGTRDSSQDLDIYLEDDHVAGNSRNPPFDPKKNRHPPYWPGDISAYAPGGFVTWVVRDSPPGIHYKVFVKLATDPSRLRATSAFGGVYGTGISILLPEVGLTPERPWVQLGTLTGQPGGKLEFQAAADLPAPTVAPALTRPPVDQKAREEMLRRLREEHLKRGGATPAPAATPNQR
jgi:gas vesicle protein